MLVGADRAMAAPSHSLWLARPAANWCAGGELSYEKAAEKVNGAANLERLRAVKARVDPGNTFRHSPFTKVLAVAAK